MNRLIKTLKMLGRFSENVGSAIFGGAIVIIWMKPVEEGRMDFDTIYITLIIAAITFILLGAIIKEKY